MKLFLCLFLSIAARASTVYFDSNASVTNDSGDPTVDLSGTLHPDPSWAAALPNSLWISYGSTGFHNDPGHFSPADGTMVVFTDEFTLAGVIMDAGLIVEADDEAALMVNGYNVVPASTSPGMPCGGMPVGCVSSMESVYSFASLEPYLIDGSNTLLFTVTMVRGQSFGLDFAGSVETSPTPEPRTFALIAGGLVGLSLLRRRK